MDPKIQLMNRMAEQLETIIAFYDVRGMHRDNATELICQLELMKWNLKSDTNTQWTSYKQEMASMYMNVTNARTSFTK